MPSKTRREMETTRSREQPPGLHLIRKLLQGQQPGGIDGRHVSEAQNDHARKLGKLMYNLVQLVRGSKQERAVDAEYSHVRRNHLVLRKMSAAAFNRVRSHPRNLRRRRDFAYEHQDISQTVTLSASYTIGQPIFFGFVTMW
jgi:hypothetical protein